MTLKKDLSVLVFVCLFLCNCYGPGGQQEEITVLQQQLMRKTQTLERLRVRYKHSINAVEGKLIHTVFFNLKDDLKKKEVDQFRDAIESLRSIDTVENLFYGHYFDVGDERAMDEMEWMMQMVFTDKSSLDSYQSNPLHQKVKRNIGSFLDGPPITYDYKVYN